MTTTPSPAFSTCDFCDTFKNDASGAFRVLPPVWRDFGGISAFSGPVSTVQCFEDNSLVKAAVDSPGLGRAGLWWHRHLQWPGQHRAVL